MANNQIEIYCGERLIDPELDLRTVKNLIWKKPGSIEFHYRRRRHNQDEYTAWKRHFLQFSRNVHNSLFHPSSCFFNTWLFLIFKQITLVAFYLFEYTVRCWIMLIGNYSLRGEFIIELYIRDQGSVLLWFRHHL